VSENFHCVTLKEDDIFGKASIFQKMKGIAQSKIANTFFPQTDKTHYVDDLEEVSKLLEELKLAQGQAIPESYNEQSFDMQSDDSFSRIFFYGIGAPLLAAQKEESDIEGSPFVVDMPLQKYEVRGTSFRRYGAKVYFSEDQQVTAIYDYDKKQLFKPDVEGWEAAKYLAKVTGLILITTREHFTWTHLVLANTTTWASTLKLSPAHPLRRLLTIFTFRTTEVNAGAFKMLVPKLGLLHRGTAFEYDALQQVFEDSYKECTIYEPFSKRTYNKKLTKLSDDNKFPYIKQGNEYYAIVRDFVSEWYKKAGHRAMNDKQARMFYDTVKESTKGQTYQIPDYSSKDDMIDLVSQIIFTVTAFHELVGTVVEYTCLPNRAGFRVEDDKTETDLQCLLLQLVITATTAIRMPSLMSKFDNFFGTGGAPEWEKEVWKNFQEKLEDQSKNVRKADDERDVEFKYFDPSRFECSVSV